MDPTPKNLCRFCMLNIRNSDVGSIRYKKLLKIFKALANFQDVFNVPLVDDELPPNVCDNCYQSIHTYLAFRQKCIESYNKFKSSLRKAVDVGELKLENGETETKIKEETEEGKPQNEKKSPRTKLKHEKFVRKPKQCTICGKVVARLDNHMLIHQADRRYICHFCDRRIATKGNLTKHLRIHLQIRIFKCHICTKDFIDTSSLKKHLVVHSGARDYKCDMCDLAFNQKGSLKYHKLQVHYKKARILCEICDRKFYVPFHYRHHMKTVHAERPKCDICSKVLKNAKSLEIHKRIHGIGLSEAENVCQICKKVCSTKNALANHTKCHSRPKGRAHIKSMKKAKVLNVAVSDPS